MADHYAVHTAVLRGMEALPVTAELDVSGGIPGMTIVGMLDSAVLEARSRIRCAIRSCGFDIPRVHITVNLAPSDIKKSGTGLDLPIAVAILAATNQIPRDELDRCLFVGELGLDGSIGDVRGGLAYALCARDTHLCLVSAPHTAQIGARIISTSPPHPIDMLLHLRAGRRSLEQYASYQLVSCSFTQENTPDFSDVIDQESAKRAFCIAATGGHGLLMMGPLGSGKTMLARRMPTILPPLSETERVEAMLVHSVCGLPLDRLSAGMRLFRAPHHAISRAGLLGGGRPITPGEASLAHRDVLFLDELPEFAPGVLQALRQPLEDQEVRLVRVDGAYSFPCHFQLIGAANPCPCGHAGDVGHTCRCTTTEITRYQGRIGGALLDRIDVFITVSRLAAKRVIKGSSSTDTKTLRACVEAGREYRAWRLNHENDGHCRDVHACHLTSQASQTLEHLARRLCLGGRAITRTAFVARTIADIDQSEYVDEHAVAEACAYRSHLGSEGSRS